MRKPRPPILPLFTSSIPFHPLNPLSPLNLPPHLHSTHGVPNHPVASAARIVPATCTPSSRYICFANSGKTPDKMARSVEYAAKAEAARVVYAWLRGSLVGFEETGRRGGGGVGCLCGERRRRRRGGQGLWDYGIMEGEKGLVKRRVNQHQSNTPPTQTPPH
jgi:hypothetical protein